MIANAQGAYVLHGGCDAVERLRLLGRVMWPTTHALFERLGLRRGMRCLDLGCGSGEVSLRLAQWVGPTGEVVGMDLDRNVLEHARSEAVRRRLSCTFRHASATELNEEGAFDLVYARFLLSHLGNCQSVLEKMWAAARPGGLVVVEDIDFSGSFCYPASEDYAQYVDWYQRVVRHHGGDPTIGPRLPSLFARCKFTDLALNVVQPASTADEGKGIAAVTLKHIRQSLIRAGIAQAGEIDTAVTRLEALALDQSTVVGLPRIFQVWGRREAVEKTACNVGQAICPTWTTALEAASLG